MKTRSLLTLVLSLLTLTSCQSPDSAPCGPLPSPRQLAWHEMEMYAFLHYSINTYTDQEWGFGNEDPQLFNPTDLDVAQWVTTCRNAGMKGIILTAKHHCGFCLWPSAYTEFSVKNSPWKDGQGDIVRELSDECRRQGLRFAVYLSPWDRNHAQYGQPEYITYFRNQLEELMTQYGDLFEVWFDGANGGDGWYGGANETRKIDRTTYYEWPETYRRIREWQPDLCIWNDGGDRGDLRWVGTEGGYVGETNWSLLNAEGPVPFPELHYGLENGEVWVAAEVDTSIRPGWFYHTYEDDQVKTVDELMNIYYRSVGRNAALLLNFPIMPNGRICSIDSLRGAEFYQTIQRTFANDLAQDARIRTHQNNDTLHSAEISVTLTQPAPISHLVLQEDIALGQRVKHFIVEARVADQWQPIHDQLVPDADTLTTIGYKRIVTFPSVTTDQLRIHILDAKADVQLKHIGVY